jgi:hypothetical protein
MSTNRKVLYLLLTLAGIIFVPYWASYFSKDIAEETKFDFPPPVPPPKAGFDLPHCIGIGLVFLAALLLFLYPKIYGFKKCSPDVIQPASKGIRLPVWFWVGLALWGGSLAALIAQWSEPRWLINWAVLPLFWGFTLMLDGWLYVRNYRKSYVSVEPRELIAIGAVSISGWLIFEYLNFFIKLNWYYPKAELVRHDDFLLYATLGSSGLMPMAFEWYFLLQTFPFFQKRYQCGRKLHTSGRWKTVWFIASFAGLAACAYFPNHLFYILWLAPLIILTVILDWLDIWTPFIPVRQGNWSPLVLFSLTYLIQGFLLEGWNYLSGSHVDGKLHATNNPAYWAYSIPFVDEWHIFEMPILGYLGYIPFGVYCWVWWIATSYLLNISKGFTFSMERTIPE